MKIDSMFLTCTNILIDMCMIGEVPEREVFANLTLEEQYSMILSWYYRK